MGVWRGLWVWASAVLGPLALTGQGSAGSEQKVAQRGGQRSAMWVSVGRVCFFFNIVVFFGTGFCFWGFPLGAKGEAWGHGVVCGFGLGVRWGRAQVGEEVGTGPGRGAGLLCCMKLWGEFHCAV